MMEFKHLRPGNLVKKDNVVVTIDARTLLDLEGKSPQEIKEAGYTFLPTNKVILERMGFREMPHSFVRSFNEVGIDIQIKKDFNQVNVYSHTKKTMTLPGSFRELHKIQNLVHVLTEQELDFV